MIDIKAIRAEAAEGEQRGLYGGLNSSTVLALCDEIEKLRKENEKLLEIFKVKHHAALRFFEKEAALEAEIERLRKEVHNLNWALGTEGYMQMATPEAQAEYENAVLTSQAHMARMEAAWAEHEAMQKDAARYRHLRQGNRFTVKCKSATVMFGPNTERDYPEQLDVAIDAAMESK